MNNDYDFLFKFILVGETSTVCVHSGVGKSCLLLRFLEGRFKNEHEPTLGVEFGARLIHVDDRKVKLQVWDTAGQESFRSITRAYYRGSIAALMVFDLTCMSSFDALKHWLREVKSNSHNKIRVCLVGNKSDLKKDREVSPEFIQEFLSDNGIEHYFETSALSGDNSDQPFTEMSLSVIKAIDEGLIKPEEDQAYGVKLHPKKASGISPTIKALADIRDKDAARGSSESEGCNC
jgi:Ras-related protein Rab-2A